jgi:hypothetical protein
MKAANDKGARAGLDRVTLHRGSTRTVLAIGAVAFKVARRDSGARCNLYEANLYGRTTPRRREILCPVIACAPNGSVLVAQAATPLSESEFKQLWDGDGFPDWDYQPADGDECPFEWKPSDWGWLNGRLVALDYSTPALPVPPLRAS